MNKPAQHTCDVRSGRLPAERLADNFADMHPPLNEMQASAEAARCLFCLMRLHRPAPPASTTGFHPQDQHRNLRGAI
jgi:hypothetical protein